MPKAPDGSSLVHLRRWWPFGLWVAMGLTGALAFAVLLGPATYPIGPFSVRLAPSLGMGETSLLLPPLGAVTAKTHRSPLSLTVELRAVDLDALQQLASVTDTAEAALEDLKTELFMAVRHFVARLLAGSVLGAALLAYSVTHSGRRWRAAAVGGLTALLVTSTLLLTAWATFDVDAFREPDYSGVLTGAPWMIDLAERALVEANLLGERLAAIAGGLQAIFSRVEQWEPVAVKAGERLVLLASDVHSNPAGLELIRSVAQSFDVDFIIDSGDLTDWGTVFEANLLRDIAQMPAPYVLVPGNHESLPFLAQMEALPNITVLWLGDLEVAGVTIAGIADPSAYNSSPRVAPASELQRAAGDLVAVVDGLPLGPDIIVAHNPDVIAAVGGRAPLLVSGHTHRDWIRRVNSSTWLNPGTTGAAGIRGLLGDGEVPYSLMLVHLSRDGEGGWQPVVVDRIQVSNFTTGFTLERHVLSSSKVEP